MVMKESGEICRDLFLDRPLICVPPYYCKKSAGELTGSRKILCGANVLSKQMEKSGQLLLLEQLMEYQGIYLMGAGVCDLQKVIRLVIIHRMYFTFCYLPKEFMQFVMRRQDIFWSR